MPSSHMSWIFVNSLDSMFLDPVVRVFFVRSSRRLGLCLRSRGLIGIGFDETWISDLACKRRDDLGSA